MHLECVRSRVLPYLYPLKAQPWTSDLFFTPPVLIGLGEERLGCGPFRLAEDGFLPNLPIPILPIPIIPIRVHQDKIPFYRLYNYLYIK